MNPKQATGTRTERDPIGEKQVPASVLYGIQTLRARENFQISSLRMDHSLIMALAEIKKAAGMAHLKLDDIDKEIGEAIIKVADEIIDGRWRDEFDLDVFQAGAGTSYNMNVNEVIANRALEILGRKRGDHEFTGRFIVGSTLGGTAVGTGTNASPEYARLAIKNLRDITGLQLKESD